MSRPAPVRLPPARDEVPLLVVAHGTTHLPGLRTLDALADRVRLLRPGLTVELSFVSRAAPHPADMLTELARRGAREAVVMPLFLGSGYHVRHDVPEAVRRAPRSLRVRTAGALGPDPMLAHVLADRLAAVCGRTAGTEVVLAAAGSADRDANADAAAMAGMLARRLGTPVRTAYLGGSGEPTVGAALARLARRGRNGGGRPVAVASYLLAEGYYSAKLSDVTEDVGLASGALQSAGSASGAPAGLPVAGPLGAHEGVARLLLRRYDQALFT